MVINLSTIAKWLDKYRYRLLLPFVPKIPRMFKWLLKICILITILLTVAFAILAFGFIAPSPSTNEEAIGSAIKVAKTIENEMSMYGHFPKDSKQVNLLAFKNISIFNKNGYYHTPWGRKPLQVLPIPSEFLTDGYLIYNDDLGQARNLPVPDSYLNLGALLYVSYDNGKSAALYIVGEQEGHAHPLGPVRMKLRKDGISDNP